MKAISFVLAGGTLLICSIDVFAQTSPSLVRVQAHAGQMDHDGILSPGEVANPNTDYDRAQRDHERNGDSRVENRDNDAAANQDRRDKRARSDQRQWEIDREREDERRRSDRYRDDDRRGGSNW